MAALTDTQREELGLSNIEYEVTQETFQMFDADGSGAIDKQELERALRILGQNPTQKEVEKMIEDADTVCVDGKLDFVEFVRMMKTKIVEPEENRKSLAESFKVFDRDQNGYIDFQELRYVLTQLGEKLTDEEVDEMLKYADLNQDGKINYDEFVYLFTKSFRELSEVKKAANS